MAKHFNVAPEGASAKLEPFSLHVPENDLSEFRELLRLSKIGASTWWNRQNDPQYGVSREWMVQAKESWMNKFDWRKHEAYINSFPNFKLPIQDSISGNIDIHFAALFSAKRDAIPVLFLHGFPASFTEFLPMMELLASKYTPETLPYHVIVPSLPDYGLSGSTSEDIEMTVEQAARLMNQFMLDLGFGDGYITQGGDLGSMIGRAMAANHEECKALHINMLALNMDQNAPSTDLLNSTDLEIMDRSGKWMQTGLAYALEHGTRPSTAGLAISASPLSLLAWIGEKLLEWTDPRKQFDLETILNWVTFYWFTDTFPRSLYHADLVKSYFAGKPHPTAGAKPLGYSKFAYDCAVLPRPWAEILYPNLKFFKEHAEGGHFSSLEQPEIFLEDVEGFVQCVEELLGSK